MQSVLSQKKLLMIAEHYEEIGDYKNAAEFYSSVLSMKEQQFGSEHADLADDLYNLGLIYFVMDANEKAEDMLLRALAIQRRCLGARHADTLETLNVLAMVSCGDSVPAYDIPLSDPMMHHLSSLSA